MLRTRGGNNKQRGFSLIEVLIALVVLGVGLLGLVGLQTSSLRGGDDAYLRSQATLLAYNIIDRIRANPKAASSYERKFSDAVPTGATDCAAQDCSTSDLAKWDLVDWLDTLQGAHGLPNAKARINTKALDHGTGTSVTVRLKWSEQHLPDNATAPVPPTPTSITIASAIYDE